MTEAKDYCASKNMTLAPFLKHKDSGTLKDWIRYLFYLHPRWFENIVFSTRSTFLGRHFGLICSQRNLMFYRIQIKKLSWLMKSTNHYLRRDSKLILWCHQVVNWRSFNRYLIGYESYPARISLKTHPKFRNGYSYDFELSNGRNYLDAERDQ